MKAVVLKPFRYSTDGVTARLLVEGTEEDIVDEMAPGLAVEGFIRPLTRDAPKRALKKPNAAKGTG